MNLIIDIGNTVAKIAVFEGKELKEVFYDSKSSLDSLPKICRQYKPDKGILATVIELSETVKEQLGQLDFEILILNSKTPIPITNLYATPETLGSDRLAAIVAANEIFPERDILVIDAGTCITYELIDAKGQYHGGNISPGMAMRFKALNLCTDKLPLINEKGAIPEFGNSTDTAIRAGVIKGMEFEINGYSSQLTNKYPGLLVFLTGGNEFSFDTNLKSIIFADRFLVLKGLNRILSYNEHI